VSAKHTEIIKSTSLRTFPLSTFDQAPFFADDPLVIGSLTLEWAPFGTALVSQGPL